MTRTGTTGDERALTPLGAAAVRWDGGFWGAQLERTRRVTVPTMWTSLSTPEISAGWRNFLVAAGEASGEHAGPPFLDGDLYKWLEAATILLETAPDPELEALVDSVARGIAAVQRADGYLHTPTIIAARNAQSAVELADRFNFETYNLGHLITLGVRHHRVTGSELLLDVARRAAGWLEDLAEHRTEQLAASAICPSHYMAVVELYRETGDERYLRLAERFVQVRDEFDGGDDNQDRVRVREQQTVAGHAVRANYLYAGLADLVAETGDAELRSVLERLWNDVVDTKLYLTGGCGALYDGASPDGSPWQREISRVHQAYGRAYQLPQTTAHNESCANIGMILWSERMLALTGDPRYAEVIEQIAYNALLASISLDGTRYFYTNPLRQVRGLPYPLRMPGETAERPTPPPPPSDERQRSEYLSVFCCPPNIARTLARFQELAMSSSPAGLWVHLYGDAEARAGADTDRELGIVVRSEQPWGERVTITVTEASGGGVPLHLRVPDWADGASVSVNGASAEPVEPGTYATVDRTWVAGDLIELHLPMRVRIRRAHRLAEEAANQVAVTRGPIVYALESHDLPDGVRLEQVALRRDIELTPIETVFEGQALVVLEGTAVALPTEDADALYTDLEQDELRTIPIRLIPYFAWGNRGAGEMSVWLPLVW